MLLVVVVVSCEVMSDSFWPHGLQHTKPPCLSLSPIVCPSPYPLHLWYHPAISSSPPALNLTQPQGLFQWFGSSIRWPKYWSFSISPSNEYSGLIPFFRLDWFDPLAIRGTLNRLLQHHNSKTSIPQDWAHIHTWLQGRCAPLEERMANHSTILALRTLWTW